MQAAAVALRSVATDLAADDGGVSIGRSGRTDRRPDEYPAAHSRSTGITRNGVVAHDAVGQDQVADVNENPAPCRIARRRNGIAGDDAVADGQAGALAIDSRTQRRSARLRRSELSVADRQVVDGQCAARHRVIENSECIRRRGRTLHRDIAIGAGVDGQIRIGDIHMLVLASASVIVFVPPLGNVVVLNVIVSLLPKVPLAAQPVPDTVPVFIETIAWRTVQVPVEPASPVAVTTMVAACAPDAFRPNASSSAAASGLQRGAAACEIGVLELSMEFSPIVVMF